MLSVFPSRTVCCACQTHMQQSGLEMICPSKQSVTFVREHILRFKCLSQSLQDSRGFSGSHDGREIDTFLSKLQTMKRRTLSCHSPASFSFLTDASVCKSCVAPMLSRQVFWQCVWCCNRLHVHFSSDPTLCVGSPIVFTFATTNCCCTVFKLILGRGMSTSTRSDSSGVPGGRSRSMKASTGSGPLREAREGSQSEQAEGATTAERACSVAVELCE